MKSGGLGLLLIACASCSRGSAATGGAVGTADAGPPPASIAPARFTTASAIAQHDPVLAHMLMPEAGRFHRDGDRWLSTAPGTPGSRDRMSASLGIRASDVVELASSGVRRLRFARAGAGSVQGELRGGALWYGDAYVDTDVVAAATAHRYEELFLLRSAAAPSTFGWEVAPEVVPSAIVEGDGSLTLLDAHGSKSAKIPAPYALDAHGKKRAAKLAWSRGRIDVSIDTRGLAFPVLLDPAVETYFWEAADPIPSVPYYPNNMTFDVAHGVVVKFGSDGTWLFNGTAWSKANVVTNPPARDDAALAYDVARGRVVMFGGSTSASPDGRNDTWEWDGTNWAITCTASPCADTLPTARHQQSMAYASAFGGVVMFGGLDASGSLDDVWVYTGTVWKPLTPAGSPPLAREEASLVYDSNRSKLVLFAGVNDVPSTTAGSAPTQTNEVDTWELDPTSGWAQRSTTSPTGATFYDSPASYYDAAAKAVTTVIDGASYGWNGTTWSAITTTGPTPTFTATATYDAAHSTAYVFDGGTYARVGSAWTKLVSFGPTLGWGIAAAYDRVAEKILFVGGCDDATMTPGCAQSTATYYDGHNYYDAPAYPTPVVFAAGAYDVTSQRPVFAGGATPSLPSGSANVQIPSAPPYELSGSTTWEPITMANPAIGQGALGVAGSSGLLFGSGGGTVDDGPYEVSVGLGLGINETEPLSVNGTVGVTSWNGTTSATVSTTGAGPSARIAEAFASDGEASAVGVASHLFAFGGTPSVQIGYSVSISPTIQIRMSAWQPASPLSDFFSFDGAQWTQLCTSTTCTATTPSARSYAGMSYDSARKRLVLVGGESASNQALGDTWEWDGTAWTLTSTTGPTTFAAAQAFDAKRGRTVVFGGEPGLAGLFEYHAEVSTCSVDGDCDTGHCVDGVCCETACGTCQRCDAAPTPGVCTEVASGTSDPVTCPAATSVCNGSGTCLAKLGQACTTNAGCVTGFCADGVCCDNACAGGCNVCAKSLGATADGTCTIAAKSFPGAPACGAGACDGVGAACPSSCASDASCATGFYCASNGICTAQLAGGSVCNATAGGDCLVDGCRDCATGTCSDGFCCDTACDGSCDVCAKSLGATADGTCTHAPAGYAGAPSCAPNICTGSNASCGTTCDADAQCAAGAYCRASDHTCQLALPAGSTCTAASQCASGFCADGFCCDTACDGQCEACDVASSIGSCQAVVGAPHGTTRSACAVADPTVPCTQTLCDGTTRTSCAGHVGSSVVCAEASCAAGTETAEERCDGAGNCAGSTPTVCAPYVCGDTACRSTCTADADCVTGYQCNVATNQCEAGSVCVDGTTSKASDTGQTKDCTPFVCEQGKCVGTCATSGDCASGYVCDATSQLCVAAGATGAKGGCAVASSSPSRDGGDAVGLLVALIAWGTKARRRPKSR